MTLTRFAAVAVLLAAVSPALAQVPPQVLPPPAMPPAMPPAQAPAAPVAEPGFLDKLVGGVLNQMFEEAAPHLDNLERDLGALAESMKPTFENIGALIDDIGNYEPPERLPNGDVIIRRKPGAPPPPPLPALPEGGLAPFPDTPAPEGPADLFNPVTPGGEIEL